MTRRKSDPNDPNDKKPLLPLNIGGNRSNGEWFEEPTKKEKLIEKIALEKAEVNAKRVGMSRRSFLATSAGLATTLSAVKLVTGCGGSGGGPDYTMCGQGPSLEELECDLDGAREVLDPSDMFIMDVQTHHVDADNEYDSEWQETNFAYAFFFNSFFVGSCPENLGSTVPCLGRDDFADLIFRQSDVTVGVLSTFPALTCEQAERIGYPVPSGICGDFLPDQAIADTRDLVNQAAGSLRMWGHAAVLPNPSSHLSAAEKDAWVQESLRGMENAACDANLSSWKCYTAFGALPHDKIKDLDQDALLAGLLTSEFTAEGFWLTDEYGQAMIEQAIALNTPIINVHKGPPLLSFNPIHGSARDVGPSAVAYPNVTFIVYHSGINFNGELTTGVTEGPYVPEDYTEDDDPLGINTLIHSVVINGLSAEGKGSDYISNVVAELGGPGARAIFDNEQGTHIFGKLLKYIGENNIVWGTDAIWGGSPQNLIQGFLAFEMDEGISETYGYPELTMSIKAKIMGLNAARIHGVDIEAKRCEIADDAFAKARTTYKEMMARNPEPVRMSQLTKGPRTRREFFNHWLKSPNFPA